MKWELLVVALKLQQPLEWFCHLGYDLLGSYQHFHSDVPPHSVLHGWKRSKGVPQNHRMVGLEGVSGDHLVQAPAKAGSHGASCMGSYPGRL